MSTKQELVEKIVHLLLTEFEPYRVTAGDRAFLEQSSIAYLQTKLHQLQNEVTVKQQARALAQQDPEVQRAQAELAAKQRQVDNDLAWLNIIRTPINGRFVADNLANWQIVFGWPRPGEAPTVSWFKKVLEENPKLANQIHWESAETRDPVKRQQAVAEQLVRDRQIFAQACRQLRIGENEANFGIIRETLGEGFSVYQVSQAISSGAVRLAQATQEEIAQWAAEAVEQRNEFLLTADNQTLRSIARREGAERRTAAAQQEADRQFQASQIRDAAIGYPPLPDLWRGQKLDAEFIKRADVSTLKFLRQKFGGAAVDSRLRGN